MNRVTKIKRIEDEVRKRLKLVMDPELHVNIVDLGLVYGIEVDKEGLCTVIMTLTTPGCPMIPLFEAMINSALKKVPQVKEVKINLTFEPPWDASKMTEETRVALGF